jgi:acetylornithine deacetylase/succinyl-diaminopimelate desuccinylase-like protein
MRTIVASVVLAFGIAPSALAQNPDEIGARLLRDPVVKAALDAAGRNEPQVIEDQMAICEVPAPPFKEAARAAAYKRRFEALGLKNVRMDGVGNVLGERPGLGPRPHLVMAAHLDTVFPEGTPVTPRREGALLAGPGIGDDCRGLAVLLGVIRALDEAGTQTAGSITFVGNVGEEGLGDLRGAKALFNDTLKGTIDRFVSIDGTGSGITNEAVGSFRYRVTFKGPGGHSYGAFGLVNPVHALGRAIAAVADFQVPAEPKTTFNVGRIGGGTSINSIAFEAWMEIDMRSADQASLVSVDARFHKALEAALASERERWGRQDLTVNTELLGRRPGGRTAPDSFIVRAARSVTTALGLEPRLGEGSTDSNVPMSLGIPAITVGGGGRGTGAHSLAEAFDTTDSHKGTQRAILLAVALTQADSGR